jgi:putative ABC transport system permease protein
MKPIIKKLVHEFWLSKGKLLLCITASALSIWGISSVVYGYLMTERDFKINFGKTNPAHFAITVQGYSLKTDSILQNEKDISGFERREVVMSRIKDNKGLWMPLILQGVEDYSNLRFDKFTIVRRFDSSKNAVLIEQDAVDFLDYEFDSITVQFPSSSIAVNFSKGGIVHDARMAPAKMEKIVYGYTTISNLQRFLGGNTIRLLIVTKNITPTEKAYREIAERLKSKIEHTGSKVVDTYIPNPGEHIHQPVIDGISFLQQAFGAVLIILGITLLALIWLIWLFPQLVQIGTMKALGASRRNILTSYVLILLFILTTGLIVGLPAGYKTAFFYDKFIAKFQNFTQITTPFPIYITICIVLICLVVPMLFGVIPLIKITGVTVREAFNAPFKSSNSYFIRKLRQPGSNLKLFYALSNVSRTGIRSVLLFLLLASGATIFFSGINLSYSIRKDIEGYYNAQEYELTVSLTDTYSQEIKNIEKLSFVESVAYILTKRVSYKLPGNGKTVNGIMRVYDSSYSIPPQFMDGVKQKGFCEDCIYLSPSTVKNDFPGLVSSNPVEVTQADGATNMYKYAGIIKEKGASAGLVSIFLSGRNNSFNQLAINIKKGYPQDDALRAIENLLQNNKISVRNTSSAEKMKDSFINHMRPTFAVIQYMGLFTLLVGMAGMLIILSLVIKERNFETGIIKALGAKDKDVSKLFLSEFSILGIAPFLAGLLFSLILTDFLSAFLGSLISGQDTPALFNYATSGIAAAAYILFQSLLIYSFTSFQMKKTTTELLNKSE